MNVRLTSQQKIKVANSKDVWLIMRQILRRENKLQRGHEHLWTIGLDKNNKIAYIELLAIGTENIVAVKTKQIFKIAIYKDAESLIVVHNHPSGILEPSDNDENLTQAMKHAGNFIDIKLYDHLIISDKGYYSFREKRKLS